MERFAFEVPGPERKADAIAYIREFYAFGSDINGAGGLLIMLIVHIGKKNKPAQAVPKKPERDDLAWIDELEVLDAIMDDFI